MAIVLAVFGVETNQQSLEQITPEQEPDLQGVLAGSSLPYESHR
jgi:hypothetical protein